MMAGLLVVVACSGGGGSVDYDGDGLSDAEEAELGTDPQDGDSDDDGWFDGDEVDAGTDPLDADDFPYTGGWPKDACRDDIDGEGYEEGSISPDFGLTDQFGEQVHLHDFCDHYVLLTWAGAWVMNYGTDERPEQDYVYETYLGRDDLVVLTLLGAGMNPNLTPTQADLIAWDAEFETGTPILADPNWGLLDLYGWPKEEQFLKKALIGPGAEVLVTAKEWVDIQAVLPPS